MAGINVPPVPYKTPLLDSNGKLTVPWIAWFRQLFERVGGNSANLLNNPMANVGDMIYGSTGGAPTDLVADVTNTRKFLRTLSILGISQPPVWDVLSSGDIPQLAYVTSVAVTVPTFLSVSGSPITSAGTIAITLSGSALPIASGGTGQITAAAAFNALSPVTVKGDLIIGTAPNTSAALAIGSSGNVLTVSGGTAVWAPPSTSGTVTSVGLSVPSGSLFGTSGTPVTTAGTLGLTTAGTSGGIAYFSSTTQLNSSGLLVTNGVVLGGGAGNPPTTLATSSSTVFPLISGGTGAAPSWAGLTVGGGGTGLTAGTSGGILGFTAAGTLASSGALTVSQLIIGGGAGATPSTLAAGSAGNVLTMSGGVPAWAPPATAGTVTSVAMTVPAFLSIGGSPITGAGTLALTLSSTALPLANGGTGLTSGTSGGILAYTASGTLASSGALTAGQVLIGGGAGVVPSSSSLFFVSGTNAFVNTVTQRNSGQLSLDFTSAARSGMGINDTSAGSGAGASFMGFLYQNTLIGTISNNSNTGVLYNITSDYRLKENVRPLSDGLDRILKLKPSYFSWIKNAHEDEGFIAHEVQELFPNAVSGQKDAATKDGSIIPQGMDSSRLIAALVASVQTLSAKLNAIEAKLAAPGASHL